MQERGMQRKFSITSSLGERHLKYFEGIKEAKLLNETEDEEGCENVFFFWPSIFPSVLDCDICLPL